VNKHSLSGLLSTTGCCLIVLSWFIGACSSANTRAEHAVQLYCQSLENYDPDIVPGLRDKLINYGPVAVPAIVRALPGKSGLVKSELILVLDKMGEQALTRLSLLLETEKEDVRLEILRVMEQLANPMFERPLLNYYEKIDDTHAHYYPVVKILAQLGNQDGFTALWSLLTTGSVELRLDIVQFLRQYNNEQTVQELIKALAVEQESRIKIALVETLAQMAATDAVDTIKIHGLEDKTSHIVREASARALHQITGEAFRYRDAKSRMKYPD